MKNYTTFAQKYGTTFALNYTIISAMFIWFVAYATPFFIGTLNVPLEIALGFKKFFEPQGLLFLA